MAGSEALKFTVCEGVAAPMPMDNVDTDMIIPKQFLKTVKRTGLGAHVFDEMRFDSAGNERPEFLLNRPPYRSACILVAGANFGCGSSREHAPWALKDFGIRCVIAESFADIFYNNCFQNGMLPVILARAHVSALADIAAEPDPVLKVDLEHQEITAPGKEGFAPLWFDIDEDRKRLLLLGLDAIGVTLEHEAAILAFEAQDKQRRPWLYRPRLED